MNKWIHFNGSIIPAHEKLVTAGNRGLRYGDGLFETMKVTGGTIHLFQRHVHRLLNGLGVLQIPMPGYLTAEYLQSCILELCRQNNVIQAARVRLSIFRGNGTLYATESAEPCLVIEAEPLADHYTTLNEKGLVIDVYEAVRKSCDVLCNLKSNNYLPYIMAALHVKQNGLDDAIILNTHGGICDTTIANIFCVKGDAIFTPALTEGCVAGVMRGYLISVIPGVQEQPLTIEQLLDADEVFLTNALYGIRWVQQLKDKQYTHATAARLHEQLIKKTFHNELS